MLGDEKPPGSVSGGPSEDCDPEAIVPSERLVDAAPRLAAEGRPALPCRWQEWPEEDQKAPLIPRGHLNATTDPGRIVQWWGRFPKAMIGSPVPPHLVVLDIDPRNGGSVAALEALAGLLPDTLIVWSGRGDGGHHRFYRRP